MVCRPSLHRPRGRGLSSPMLNVTSVRRIPAERFFASAVKMWYLGDVLGSDTRPHPMADGDMMASASTQAKKAPAGDDIVPLAISSLDEIAGEDPPIVLSLADLVSDQNDEVVLFNDSGLRTLAVSTSAA